MHQGLPPEWETLLIGSGIDKAEIVENSQAILEVLEFVDKRNEQQKPKPAQPAAAANPEVAKLMAQAAEMGIQLPAEKQDTSLKDLVNTKDDPNVLYSNQIKVGEGYVLALTIYLTVIVPLVKYFWQPKWPTLVRWPSRRCPSTRRT